MKPGDNTQLANKAKKNDEIRHSGTFIARSGARTGSDMRHHLANIRQNERGASLIVVVVVLVVILIGGLAAIAVTSGQLSKTRGFRTKAVDEACAEAGLARMRAMMPNVSSFDATEGTISGSGIELTYRAGHYDGDGTSPLEVLDPSTYDASSLYVGENIANVLGSGGGGNLSTGVHLIRMTAVCGGTGHGTREVETIFKY